MGRVTDHVERLRGLVRLELPEEVWLLLSTVTDGEWDRLRELRLRWPVERGWPPPRAEVRRRLDRVVEEWREE